MYLTLLELLIESLLGCALLFGISVLFTGMFFATVGQWLTAFAVCYVFVVLCQLVINAKWFTDDK